jgi:hypothetical protein
VALKVSPTRAWTAFGEVGKWWADEHSFSGKASNMRLDLVPGGCWCETFPGGGAQFMHVVFARPPKEIVLSGALGPMLYDVAPATMIVRFEPDGSGTKATMTYKASGFLKGDADKTAPLVDQVLGEQLNRLRAFLEKG